MTDRGFASDNAAGVHPAVLDAITRANEGHAFGYGRDDWTHRAEELLREQFGSDVQPFLVWGGTGANVLSLRAICRPWEAAIWADCAHLNVDEAGAPEAIAGVELLDLATEHGKLTPTMVERAIVRVGDQHVVQPRVASVSEATELGTVYSREEVTALADTTHANGLVLHMDGARLSNAAAAIGCSLRDLSAEAGVDALSFGGTKNGLLGAEVIVFLKPELAEGFVYLRKQSLQLASKMRFLAAQIEALLHDELWRSLAAHANAMAAGLAAAISELPGVRVTHPVESNAVFATLPRQAIEALRAQFAFYVWDEARDEVRWMCSWDTTEDDIERLVSAARAVL